MKYIRTKDGKIIDLTAYKESGLINNGIKFVNKINASFIFIQKDNILKQADIIEELCDEFVLRYIGKLDIYYEYTHYYDFEEAKRYADEDCVLFGAIWTDKGLIYVAKMNEKGELELL